MKLVWDKEIPFVDRLNAITSKQQELGNYNLKQNDGKLLKSLRKLKLDFYFNFTTDLDSIKNWSKKGKQLELAKKVMITIKDGDRKYKINLGKRVGGDYFIQFFENTMETTKFHLCSLGINFYNKPSYSFKTLVLGAVKMKKLGFIGKEKLNAFLQALERDSYNGK